MQKCRDCNSTMKKDEVECFMCGARVPTETSRTIFGKRFASVIKFMFLASLVISVISLFASIGPSFTECITTTFILFFVKSSADQMLERKKT